MSKTHHGLQSRLDKLNEDEQVALIRILDAMFKAKEKFPEFHKGSLMYAAGIVSEEAGEFSRAVNQFCYENGETAPMVEEATHVGATALRALVAIDKEEAGSFDNIVADDQDWNTRYAIRYLKHLETEEHNEAQLRFKFQQRFQITKRK